MLTPFIIFQLLSLVNYFPNCLLLISQAPAQPRHFPVKQKENGRYRSPRFSFLFHGQCNHVRVRLLSVRIRDHAAELPAMQSCSCSDGKCVCLPNVFYLRFRAFCPFTCFRKGLRSLPGSGLHFPPWPAMSWSGAGPVPNPTAPRRAQ